MKTRRASASDVLDARALLDSRPSSSSSRRQAATDIMFLPRRIGRAAPRPGASKLVSASAAPAAAAPLDPIVPCAGLVIRAWAPGAENEESSSSARTKLVSALESLAPRTVAYVDVEAEQGAATKDGQRGSWVSDAPLSICQLDQAYSTRSCAFRTGSHQITYFQTCQESLTSTSTRCNRARHSTRTYHRHGTNSHGRANAGTSARRRTTVRPKRSHVLVKAP